MYGSVVCTPPTRRSVYTHQWKYRSVYCIHFYTSNFFRIDFSRFSIEGSIIQKNTSSNSVSILAFIMISFSYVFCSDTNPLVLSSRCVFSLLSCSL